MSGLPSDPGLPTTVRHPKYVVLYSPGVGVYLGDGRWSFTDGEYKDTAMVFDNDGQIVTPARIKGFYPDAPTDAVLYEVYPSNSAFGASKDECANVGLPRWY